VADVSVSSCLLIYFLSFACDELDGRFARMFNQTSRLGAVLDMATDRVSTAGLLALLCKFAPTYHLLWVMLIILDIGSHWFQMYASLACSERTHKVCPLACRDWLLYQARHLVLPQTSHIALSWLNSVRRIRCTCSFCSTVCPHPHIVNFFSPAQALPALFRWQGVQSSIRTVP
jgi:hypothetical protein